MNNKNSAILCDFTLNFTPYTPKSAQSEQKNLTDGLSVRERRDLNRKIWTNTPLDFDFIENDTTMLCGMKRIGISHIKDEKPCQDNFKLFCDNELGIEIIVAADGHGDKKHDLSQIGSTFACCALTDTVINAVKKQGDLSDIYFKSLAFKEDIIKAWNELVFEYHKSNYADSGETSLQILTRYGTTLLFAFCYGEKFYVGRLGDGGIILSAKDHRYTLFAGDDKLGTSTCSMCMENSHMLLNIKVYNTNELDSVMLMTDGMFDIFTEEKYLFNNMSDFLGGIQKEELARDDYFKELYNQYVEYITDDTTVCILTKKTPAKTEIDSYFEAVGICPDSIQYRERSIKACYRSEGVGYTAIFSKAFTNYVPSGDDLFGFIAPVESIAVGEYICNIYYNTGAGDYKNVYEIIDEMIKKRRTKIADDKIMNITNCLLPFISSKEPELFTASDELLFELIEYSETDGCVRIFSFSENEIGNKSYRAVMAQLLISLLSGGITDKADIINAHINTDLPFSCRSSIVNANLMRADRKLLNTLTDIAKGEDLFTSENVHITHRCKACGNIIWTYKNIALCPHCSAQLISKAVISSDFCDVFGHICTGTTIEIYENCNSTVPVITLDAVKNPLSGQLGIKNTNSIHLEVPDDAVTIQPGQIKGITKDTVIKINDWNFNISLLK